MYLPNSGKIVVIDDKYDEVESLIKALSKIGASYLYYDGTYENLPEKPIRGVRFLFLDIELSDSIGSTDKNKASTVAGKVSQILGETPGPYFIMFWTGHSEVIEIVLSYLKDLPPIGFTDLEKPSKDDLPNTTIENITNRIKESLKEIGAFEFYVQWENMVNISATRFVDEFANVISKTDDIKKWSEGTEKLLGNLSKHYHDEPKLSGDHKKDLFGAISMVNDSFSDIIRSESIKFNTEKISLTLRNDNPLEIDVAARLNNQLFYDFSSDQSLTFGSICILDDSEECLVLKKAIKNGVVKKEAVKNGKLCCVIITPECDLANKKMINMPNEAGAGETEYLHRIVYGYLFKWDKSPKDLNKVKTEKGKDALFSLGPFLLNDESHFIFLHFGTIANKWFTDTFCVKFSIKRELAFDLQSKAANHVNRLGNSQMSYL